MPASRGFAWLVQGMTLVRLQAGRLLLIAVLMQLVLGLTQVPLLGVLVIVAVPGFGAGLLEALHVTAGGGRPDLRLLFKPLATAPHSGRLLAMGALVFAVGVVSMSLLLTGSDELTDPALLQQIEQGDLDALSSLNQESLGRMAMAFLIGLSVSGTLSYFTVPLIWFHGRKTVPALLSGLKALVVNWKPLLLLGLGMSLLLVPVALVSSLLFGLAGGAGWVTTGVLALIMILLLLFQLLLFSTQYCAFREIFGLDIVAPDSTGEDDQLVA